MNSLEIPKNLSIPVVGANSTFLPLNGPMEMIRESSLIFFHTPWPSPAAMERSGIAIRV
jgi:hypothetical protein